MGRHAATFEVRCKESVGVTLSDQMYSAWRAGNMRYGLFSYVRSIHKSQIVQNTNLRVDDFAQKIEICS